MQDRKGKKIALALGAVVAGVAALPVIAFVNAAVGLVVLSLPVAMVMMAS
jgi:hypothetical protein